MNNTVTLPQLIARLAAASGCTPAEARKYIHDLFAAVEEALADGKSYTIEGIGEFAPGFEAGNPVLFRPDESLAAALNEPFAAFSAVEIPAELDEKSLEPETGHDVKPQSEPETQPESQSEPEPDTEPVSEPEPAATPEIVPIVESEPTPTPEPEGPAAETETPAETPEIEAQPISEAPQPAVPAQEPQPAPAEPTASEPEEPIQDNTESAQPDDDDEDDAPTYLSTHSGGHGMWLTIGILIGLIVGLVGGYFAGAAVGRYHIPEDEELLDSLDNETDTLAVAIVSPVTVQIAADTAATPSASAQQPATNVAEQPAPTQAAAPSQPSATTAPKPVYDTVTSTQFLTSLARKHYGVKSYWVFIYEANPSLGNPNRIQPGTRVLIPDRASFEESTPEATAAKAQQHLNALSAKYKF